MFPTWASVGAALTVCTTPVMMVWTEGSGRQSGRRPPGAAVVRGGGGGGGRCRRHHHQSPARPEEVPARPPPGPRPVRRRHVGAVVGHGAKSLRSVLKPCDETKTTV